MVGATWASILVLGVGAATAATTLYVAPTGDDRAAGSREAPLASLAGARDRVRVLRREAPAQPVDVVLAGGVYPITEAVVFGPEDSGSAAAPVTYQAAPGARPVISGGQAITGWQRDGNLWVADVPAVRDGWRFHQLFVNGQRAVRARTPNQGYHRLTGFLPGVSNPSQMRGDAKACVGFQYGAGDIDPGEDLSEATVVLYHSWTNSLHFVESIDPEARLVRFSNRSGWPIGYWERNQRYHLEGVRSALDQPGEWYLDSRAGRVYYYPRPGEELGQVEAVAPVARQLLRLAGDPELGLPVSHLVFRGLSFQHADWQYPRSTSLDGQAAVFLDALVTADGARHCRFEDLEIAHGGSYGLWFRRGCKDNSVARTRIHDLGGGGVRLGESDTRSGEALSERNEVDNCWLHHLGQVFAGACGVLVQRSSGNRITHNEISDLYYTGISVGWSWGYQPSTARDNLIAHNHVHHLGWGVLSDMGGIYTLGISPGTQVVNNSFHDILSYSYGGWGMYTDEGSSGILFENNLSYNTKTGGFHQHYGRDNIIRNNVLAFSAEGQLQRTRNEDHNSFTFERNIVYTDRGELLSGNWSNDRFVLDRNVYWHAAEPDPEFFGHSWDEWQAKGHDRNSRLADPLLVDPKQGNFGLRAESPALALGFQPIDASTIGLYGEPAWVAAPQSLGRPAMVFPTPAPPRLLSDDFETSAVGDQPRGAVVSGETEKARIRVTDETAAGGQHSLKVTDAAGLSHSWDPHFYWRLNHRRGLATVRFDLRFEPGAKLYHEWRDTRNPYRAGPSLHILPDGQIQASGRKLLQAPPSQWFGVSITCPLGRQATGHYTVEVRLAGQPPQRFEGLPCAEGFRSLEWLGFVSESTDERVFYLDNLDLSVAAP